MNTTTAAPAVVNADGFPLVTCSRCGGSGEHSYNARTGRRCFRCAGSGWTVRAGKAAKAYTALITDRVEAREPSALRLVVGSHARQYGDKVDGKPAPRDLVLAVQVLGLIPSARTGRNGIAEYSHVEYSLGVTFQTFAGVEYSRRISSDLLMSCRTQIDPAPYLAAAGLRPQP